MKKIAILTFPKADNYGALLQAYALKQTLINQGNLVEIINYFSPKVEAKRHILAHFKLSLRWMKQILKLPIGWYRSSHFAAFKNKYLMDMAPVYYDTLPTLSNKYDLFITGSDQVFNLRITWFDDRFFLSFCADKNKNASYAASFGFELHNLTDKEKEFIKENLNHIQYLSVREKQGKEIVQALAPGKGVQVHIDPALLLTKADWEKIAKRPSITKPYCILFLIMHRDEAFIQYAKRVAQEKGWKLLFVSPHFNLANILAGIHKAPTVEEWLGLFLNAQYVFTNSFHGLAFSINFNKPFMVGPLNPKWPAASRLNNLLDITGLQHRKFNGASSVFREEEDWDAVNKKLEQERQKAFEYLKMITK